jgi:[ribosomal protein S5]-alanine N-acetyltransferase
LREISKSELIELMNHPLVKRHMPLTNEFGEADYNAFISNKEKMWEIHGYGPWAFFIDGKCIGWGGLQPFGGDVEIALVLSPDKWGYGKMIYKKIIHWAFYDNGLPSIIILFPLTRRCSKALVKMGFKADGKIEIDGIAFLRYRLSAPSEKCS